MIYFFADDHYGVHPGKCIYDALPSSLRAEIRFTENDWTILENGHWHEDCSLLILNFIGGSCGQPLPGQNAERSLRTYCDSGKNIILLHGASSAFWNFAWWRPLTGLRWVRGNDPDGMAPSVHPTEPYRVVPAKTRHPLALRLETMDFPADEIYTELEQTCPVSVLMQTTISSGTWPQCCEAETPAGGRIVSLIPGHISAVTQNAVFLRNFRRILDYLRNSF